MICHIYMRNPCSESYKKGNRVKFNSKVSEIDDSIDHTPSIIELKRKRE